MKALFASHHPAAGTLMLGDHHYLREFRRDGWECLWIAGLVNAGSFLRRPARSVAEWRRVFGAPRTVATPAGEVREWVAGSPLPYRDGVVHRAAQRCLGGLLYPRARRVLRAAGFDPPDVLWLGNLRLAWLMDLFPSAIAVHRIGDRVGEFPGAPRDVAALQKRVVARADVVIATAAGLAADVADVRRDVVVVPNGVEAARFGGPLPPEPARLAAEPRPRVCYVGAIESWFDWAALTAAAARSPQARFLLIGPATGTPPSLPPNVVRIGPVPYAEVPAWLRHADMGLLPFVRNALTHEVSPLKVFEYLAAGLPVVSTDLRATRALGLPIALADTPAAFAEAVAAALAAPGDAAARRASVAAHDWQARFGTVRDLIAAARARRPAGSAR